MNVYLYPSNTETELKNAYIGEYVLPYLCFTAEQANSTLKFDITNPRALVTLETSTDGEIWTSHTLGNTITLSNVGDKVYMRNTSETPTQFGTSSSKYYHIAITGKIAASGDINYLLCKNSTNTIGEYCFYCLFQNNTGLTSAPKLPATTLGYYCYQNMFTGCTALTTVPEILPATALAEGCYYQMFYNCTSLETAPELPATALASYCYYDMFRGCTGLTTIPALPATSVLIYCYYQMFYGCSKIKLSSAQTGEYQTAYRIPTSGTGSAGTASLNYMFGATGGTFTGTPTINTTYYTSNTVV